MVLTRTPLALWYTPVAELGGVARHVLDVARHGVPGWRLAVLCPEGPLAERLRGMGVPVLVGPVAPGDGPRAAVAAVRRILTRLRPDLLHTHLAFADLVGAAAVLGAVSGQGRRTRLVSTEHGISGVPGLYHADALLSRSRRLAHRARLHRTDHVIAVSRSTREQIRAQWGTGAPVSVIRNAVEIPDGAPDPAPGLRVLSLARLAPEKRIEDLLEAFALVRAEHPAARLTIAGDGPEDGALRRRADALGIADAVSFPGHLEARRALAAHDVLVQLSTWENLSYSLLDAVSGGLGVVATDVGGTGEILPARCLVDGTDARAVAAAIIAQGLDPAARPVPGDDTEGVDGMARAIGEVYAAVTA